ncbi:hypothetical protein Zmor_009503 [Zophobas morio]|uniref:Uncharacterized protein n=1 Tax=Zophobas morio TaxID=2755281 RepID=A0AA38IQT7_9CUCU|nr:hypothetical protein Zmor_009503 [Zophobas morio]
MRKICRLCLAEAPIAHSLLNSKYAQMLQALTSITVDVDEEINSMCLKCSLNLKLAYTIQQKILKSHEKLKKSHLDNKTIHKFEATETTPSPVQIKQENRDEITTKCIICSTVVKTECLSSHVEGHFNDKQFCDLCKENFTNLDSYRSHLQKHPELSLYKCKKCNLTFRYHSLYTIHVKAVHTPPPTKIKKRPSDRLAKQLDKLHKKGIGSELAKKLLSISAEAASNFPLQPPQLQTFVCDFCDRQFPDKNKLRHHKSGHFRRECPTCHKHITLPNFSNHVRNHDSGPQVCEQCGKTYDSVEKLRGHVFYQHSKKKYECEECKVTFKNRHGLGTHRKREHNGSGHICETCGRKFLFAYWLKKHIQSTHMKMRPHICEFCQRAFSGRNALLTHRRQHTMETPYKCEVCGEGFRQNVSLKAHRKSKHNIVEAVTCKCEVCGKGFASEHAVKAHMKCH